jgi:hypothetical protein
MFKSEKEKSIVTGKHGDIVVEYLPNKDLRNESYFDKIKMNSYYMSMAKMVVSMPEFFEGNKKIGIMSSTLDGSMGAYISSLGAMVTYVVQDEKDGAIVAKDHIKNCSFNYKCALMSNKHDIYAMDVFDSIIVCDYMTVCDLDECVDYIKMKLGSRGNLFCLDSGENMKKIREQLTFESFRILSFKDQTDSSNPISQFKGFIKE